MPNKEIEKRVVTLEKEVDVLKRLLVSSASEKNWRKTVGMFADDPEFEELLRLGRAIRKEQTE